MDTNKDGTDENTKEMNEGIEKLRWKTTGEGNLVSIFGEINISIQKMIKSWLLNQVPLLPFVSQSSEQIVGLEQLAFLLKLEGIESLILMGVIILFG